MDSEAEVLGYGISLILLNIGMYFVAPVTVVWQVKKRITKTKKPQRQYQLSVKQVLALDNS